MGISQIRCYKSIVLVILVQLVFSSPFTSYPDAFADSNGASDTAEGPSVDSLSGLYPSALNGTGAETALGTYETLMTSCFTMGPPIQQIDSRRASVKNLADRLTIL